MENLTTKEINCLIELKEKTSNTISKVLNKYKFNLPESFSCEIEFLCEDIINFVRKEKEA